MRRVRRPASGEAAEGSGEAAGKAKRPATDLSRFEAAEEFLPLSLLSPELPEEAVPLWQGWASMVVMEALEEGQISVGRAREILTWS